MDELINGNNTLEDPLVTVDPYERSPLAALVSFETDQSLEITVTVEGDDEHTTISHTYEVNDGEIHLPVLGLYPARENQVELRAENEAGEVKETTLTLITDSLPDDVLNFTVDSAEPERMGEGL